ncbi:MAG: sigma-54 dependent transcriptional regulator [Deltaproteobacteria bacterium]
MKDIFHLFFSHSPRMTKIRTIIDDLAGTDIAVLIKGESGTGKDLVAQAIHLKSDRYEKPFIKVNCATIPRNLLESELFGFERGAFTGAHRKKPGKFELANGGTILLNDIGEIDISAQAKLLQVLQDGEFFRLGGERNISVDTRILATTRDHLERSMLEGRFRQDLFYRINVMAITVPPLRDRREQIVPLSQYYFEFYKTKYGKPVHSLSLRTLGVFKNYHWPGNVVELENMIKRIVLFGEEEAVVHNLIRANGKKDAPVGQDLKETDSLNLKKVGKKAAEMAERKMIQTTLQETHWNRKDAARLLQVSYKALLNKIQKYRLGGLEALEKSGDEKNERLRG